MAYSFNIKAYCSDVYDVANSSADAESHTFVASKLLKLSAGDTIRVQWEVKDDTAMYIMAEYDDKVTFFEGHLVTPL